MELPQRVRSVHQLSMELCSPCLDLLHGHLVAGDLADVKSEVYFIGLDPARVPHVERHESQLARKDGCEVNAFGQMLQYGLVKTAFETFRQFVQVQRAHVHGCLGRLKVQERGVQAAEGVHGACLRHGWLCVPF